MSHTRTASSGAVVSIVVALASGPRPASAQIPERFTNLQVLPKDTARKDLVQIMRGWASALGVRCGHCHTGGNPETLEGVDFASDEKWEKRTARAMLRMVRAMEADHLKRLESRPVASPRHEPEVALTCATCHRGLRRPEGMDALLDRVLRAEGPEAAVRAYQELRKDFLGRGSYDFTERPINTVAERLIQEKRARDAALLLEMGAEYNPDAGWLRHLLGEARLAEGDRAGALSSFERALALSPENVLARQRVEELKAAVDPARGGAFVLSLEPNHSTVGFSVPIAKGMTRVTGKFRDVAGRIVMDERDLGRSSVEVTIQVKSVDTGIDERDAHLREAEFFDVANHPVMTFKSTRVDIAPEGYRVLGTLTMRGVAKEIALSFRKTGLEWENGRPLLGIAAWVKVRRSDFGVGTAWQHSAIPDFLGDLVDVEIHAWTRLGRPLEEGKEPASADRPGLGEGPVAGMGLSPRARLVDFGSGRSSIRRDWTRVP